MRDKSPSAPATPAASGPERPVEAPPPDPAAIARAEEASVAQAIAAGDLAAVGEWVLAGSSTRIRQMAARAIKDPDQLHDLIRATRHGNDKTDYRILTDKRDALLAEIRRAEQLRTDLETTAAAIAQHATAPYEPSYAATLGQLEAHWRTLAANATEEVQREVGRQLAAAHEVIEQHRQAIEAEAERKRAAALAAEEARRQRELAAQAAADAWSFVT